MTNLIRKSLLALFITWALVSNSLIRGNITKNASSASWENRIVGGYPCSTKKYPFLVFIAKVIAGDLVSHCGGSLLNDKFVLTAAHCFEPHRFAVLIGLNAPDKKSIRREVEKQISHPGFRKRTFRDDIGLLLLDKPVRESNHIGYAKLPKSIYKTNSLEEKCKTALIMGWGVTFDIDESDEEDLLSDSDLQCAKLPIISIKKCRSLYSPDFQIFDENMCTLSPGGKDACQGDSGGPLICGNMQVGIVSWGVGCGEEDSPGVYTRVDMYLDFINKHISPKSGIPKSKTHKKIPKASGSIKCNGIDIWFYLMLFLYFVTNIDVI